MVKNKHFAVVISTRRLFLRKFEPSDASDFSDLLQDKDVSSTTLMLPYPCNLSVSQNIINKYIEEQKTQKAIRWAITIKANKILIGGLRLVPNPDFDSAEIGFWIGKKYWGKGFAFEAAEKVCDFGLNKMLLNRIEAHAMPENISSIKLLKKLGFKKEGYHPQLVKKWGVYKDVITFGMLKENI